MSGPQTFRKRVADVAAIQWTGDNPYAVRAFTGIHKVEPSGNHHVFTVQSGHGELYVEADNVWRDIEIGDWIVRGSRGFFPCKPDIFAQTYEEAEGGRP